MIALDGHSFILTGMKPDIFLLKTIAERTSENDNLDGDPILVFSLIEILTEKYYIYDIFERVSAILTQSPVLLASDMENFAKKEAIQNGINQIEAQFVAGQGSITGLEQGLSNLRVDMQGPQYLKWYPFNMHY